MLLWGAMPEIGLEIEPEVGCIGGCGGCAVAVPEGVCAEGVCVEGVRRVCGGCAEGVCAEVVWRVCRGVSRWGNEYMSYVRGCVVAVSEHVSEDVAEHVRRVAEGCRGCAEHVWRVSCYNVVSL